MVALLPFLIALMVSNPHTSPAAAEGFVIHQIDDTQSETAAVADLNNDGRPDIIAAEYWYEAPSWTKHPLRTIQRASGYVDDFSDLPLDVDGDGFMDVIQIGYFARRIVWMKNPGKSGGAWTENLIDAVGPTEFAFLVDLDNDGKARELLPQFTGAAGAPLTWYEFRDGKWQNHQVSTRSYGHGIGVGDVNGDKRNDILTPQGWLEAPADARAPGNWTFHPTDWQQHPIGLPPASTAPSAAVPPIMSVRVDPSRPPGAAAQGGRIAEWGFLHVLDIDGDGRNDVLATSAHSYGLCWFEQRADGSWLQHVIDNSWSHAHASVLADMNGDGQPDLVTGKRYMARNAPAPGDDDPLGLYWYEFRRMAGNGVEWTRHTIAYGGRAGGGLQIAVRDVDGDGDLDIVSGGKTGLFVAENRTRSLSVRFLVTR